MYFSQLDFLDLEVRQFTRLRAIYPILSMVPGMKFLLGECHARVMLIRDPKRADSLVLARHP